MSKNWKKSEIVRAWWSALQAPDQPPENGAALAHTEQRFFFDSGHRARLRRCKSIGDAAWETSVWRLAEALGLEARENATLFLIAIALAHVKNDVKAKHSLAYLLGVGPISKDQRPLLSELRFQRLMREKEPDDFSKQLRRALSIGDSRANVAILTEDLAAWMEERNSARLRRNGMKSRWARDYYLKPGSVPNP